MSLEHWETYYRSGALVSCPMGLEPGYTREVRDAWVDFFGALADGARILDIATGNGAIPLIAKETAAASGRRFGIVGIDLAQIDPPRNVKDGVRLFDGIEFHGGVAVESLPFANGHFDALSGQYALEYLALEPALAEMRRVLKPGAPLQFVLHHHESIVVRNARESLQQAALVLEETKVFRHFRRYLDAERSTPAQVPAAWKDLVAAGERLQQAARSSQSSLLLTMTLESLRRLFEQRGKASLPALEQAVAGMEKELRASVRRLQDLVGAALAEDGLASIVATAQRLGFSDPRYAQQRHAVDKLVGWRLNLTRT